jgi:hypothetical protein
MDDGDRARTLPGAGGRSVSRRAPNAPARVSDPGLASPRISLDRSPHATLDRVLPRHGRDVVVALLGVAVATWLAGLLLAADRARFLTTPEWLVQPLYLAVHLGLLRAYVTAYATHFAGGCRHLRMPRAEVEKRLRGALGWRPVIVAVAVALPLVWIDVGWFVGDAEIGLKSGRALAVGDVLLVAVWAVEWVVNAYVWALVIAFLIHTVSVLKRHEYRDPIERVLRDRQYRPFLLMSAQGASLTLVFAGANAAYVWLTRGSTSDYVGLWVTAGLVLVGFVPAWLLLKSRVGRAVAAQADVLSDRIDDAALSKPAAGTADIARRLDGVTAILRLEYLDRLHKDLGKVEAQATVLKLLAPALTAAWRFFRPF